MATHDLALIVRQMSPSASDNSFSELIFSKNVESQTHSINVNPGTTSYL